MASKEECDRYADELTRRFDDLMQWAITHWPRKDFPLMRSDFDASRRELSEILGPKLGDPDEAAGVPAQGTVGANVDEKAGESAGDVQGEDPFLPPGMAPERDAPFRQQNPMPWP